MSGFQPSGARGHTEASWYEDPPNIPSIGGAGWPNHRQPQVRPQVSTAAQQLNEARLAEQRGLMAEAMVGASMQIPIGGKDLVLLSHTGESTSAPLRRAGEEPFYKKSWFWPVVAVGVVLGAMASKNKDE